MKKMLILSLLLLFFWPYLLHPILILNPIYVIGSFSNIGVHRETREFIALSSQEKDKVLINNGFCKNKNECYKLEYFFWEGEGSKLYFSFYSITNKRVLLEIISNIFFIYEGKNLNFPIQISAYKDSHSTYLGFAGILKRFFKRPFLKITLKENK